MQAIGYGSATAWIFPAIIDTAVAVSTLMLVALGDKPARHARTVATSATTQASVVQRLTRRATQPARAEVTPLAPNTRARAVQPERVQNSASAKPVPAQSLQDSAQTLATQVDAEVASDLIASRVTTQPVETVIAVLSSLRDGASINAAAKASGINYINYRTAQRIVEAAAERRQGQLVTTS
jgi:hypothetical protein